MLRDLFPRAYRYYTSLSLVGPVVVDFEAWLQTQGYRWGTRRNQLRAIAWIDHYLQRRGAKVSREGLDACWRWYRRRQAMVAGVTRTLEHFLEAQGRLPARAAGPLSQANIRVLAYAVSLREFHGLADKTIRDHVRTAAAFLDHLAYESTPGRLAAVTPSDVEAFIRKAGARLSRVSLRNTVAVLRGFLRFLASVGAVGPGLDTQLDTPRCYRQEQLPRALPWDTVRALLASIDRTSAVGLRDYTMLFLIATYGLRSNEVVALTLDAIDWRAGALHVSPRKHGTPLCLPLTDAAGTVLLEYLRHGRPASTHRELFLRAKAPAGVLKPSAANTAFRTWAHRSGLGIPFEGPHCLRHSIAVHLLRRGVGLKTLGDLLGHRAPGSTEAYLRLALDDLRGVPLPVPRDPEAGS